MLLLVLLYCWCAQAQFCSSGPTTTVDANLGAVFLAGSSLIIDDRSDCPGKIGVQDMTNLWADLTTGVRYSLSFNVTTCGNVFPTLSGAWIDYNQNKLYDTNESLGFTAAKGSVSIDFVPPAEVTSGLTRLRVQVQETSKTSIVPCNTAFYYGGTKDFSIYIETAPPPLDYCSSGPNTTVDSNLGLVSLPGDTVSINDDSNCPGKIGVQDFTNLKADLTIGRTYSLTLTVTTCGNSYPTLAGAWIDYNQNHIYESNEVIGSFTTTKNATVITFSPPVWAVVGITRLRVQVQETQVKDLSPCVNFAYGGTKDFTVVIGTPSPPPYCSAGPLTTEDGNLGLVSLKGDSLSIYDSTNCPGQTGVQNLTNLKADLTIGRSYSLTFTVTTCGGSFPTLSGAWIDYNQNSVYDSDELLSNFTKSKDAITIGFIPPSSAIRGITTRMRVQVQETQAQSIYPCTKFDYGGTKDFSIVIG